VDLVGRELESPPCCATSALVSLDPPANSWTGGNDVSMSRLRSARGCLAAHLSCCQPTLAACPNLQVGSGAGVADGPSGTVTRVLTGQAGAGAARRRRRTGSSTGVRGAILGQVQRDVAAALPGEGSATSIRSRRMWRHGPWRLGRPARPGGLCLITAQTSQATLARKNPPAGGRAARRSHRRRFDDRLMAVLAFAWTGSKGESVRTAW
jgi:hypothetical protein